MRLPYQGVRAVTVCVAVGFQWAYGPNDSGRAVITASDRQITAGDVEYEPPQQKICFLTPRILILVAGSYPIHSEALLYTQRSLVDSPQSDPGVVAELYASYIRDAKTRFAYQTYLSPLGLNRESFLARQQEFAPNFVSTLMNQLQNYQTYEDGTEALIIGSDERYTHIYVIDRDAHVTLHNDVGFASIGIGAWHAKSVLMRVPYSSSIDYSTALACIYAAKKGAEVAPGVGRETDLFVVNRFGWMPVLPSIKEKVNELYMEFDKKRNDAATEAVIGLRNHLIDLASKGVAAAPQGQDTTTPDEQCPPSPKGGRSRSQPSPEKS